MRFRLRTLLIALALGPALISMCYWYAKERAARRKLDEQFRNAFDNRRLDDVPRLRPELSDKTK
jgi:hypothetical protein